MDESNKSATLPSNRKAATGQCTAPDSTAIYQISSAKSIQEINVWKIFFSWRYRQNSYFFSLLNIEMRCLYCFTAVFHKNVIQPLNLYKFNFHDFKLCLSQIIVCKWTRSPLQFISPCIIYYFYEINFDLVLFLVIIRGFWRVPNCLRLSHLNWKEMSNMNPMKNKNNNLPAALNTE